jgi:hypothetical protein
LSYKEHAILELRSIGYDIKENEDEVFKKLKADELDMNDMVVENVLELLEVFSNQGHSGFSAPYVAGLFGKLATHQTLSPLTGEDWEWCHLDYGDPDMEYQNKRDSRVFKNKAGESYFIEGRIYQGPDGGTYVGRNSRVFIDGFPYTPESVYVKVDENGNEIEVDKSEA